MLQRSREVEITVMACLLAKRDMEVDAAHSGLKQDYR
jgi:hypothetical protein